MYYTHAGQDSACLECRLKERIKLLLNYQNLWYRADSRKKKKRALLNSKHQMSSNKLIHTTDRKSPTAVELSRREVDVAQRCLLQPPCLYLYPLVFSPPRYPILLRHCLLRGSKDAVLMT